MNQNVLTDEIRLAKPGMRALLIGGASALALSLTPAIASETVNANGVAIIVAQDTEEADDDEDDKVVVTGSRVRRDTFSSISPLQVITAEDSLSVGLIDPAAILQQSEAAAGTQIDQTFAGFVLDNGPGSETINFRGLGEGRTLVLINGRRLAPAGVGGAPTQPSINLIPGSLVDRYDLLLDGASSVYGSDAVAGVVNVVLRNDFDGFEFFASGDYNQQGAGHDYLLSGTWGRNTDRGFIGVGVEYDYSDRVTFGDRTFLSGCDTHREITNTGEIRTVDRLTNLQNLDNTQGLVGARESECSLNGFIGGFGNRIFDRSNGVVEFGSAYYTPGNGNLLPDFTDTGLFGVPIDRDGDGIEDIYFPDFFFSSRDLDRTLFPESKKTSIMTYGEYTFEGEMNITPYFEFMHVDNDVNINSGQGTLFPDVPATNPFNVCNPAAPGGVDCVAAQNDLYFSPEYGVTFDAFYNGGGGSANCFGFGLPAGACTPAAFGTFFLSPTDGTTAVGVSSQSNIVGDRNFTQVNLQQTRGVIGTTADLPFMNFGTFSNWSLDTSVTYSYAKGTSDQDGIRDDRLAFALGWDPTTDNDNDGVVDSTTNNPVSLDELPGGPCDADGISNPDLLQPDVIDGCVPVNLFAPSVFGGIGGDFATQAERDYLFDTRSFDTIYEQLIFSAFVTGGIYDLPAGTVSLVAGVEYREDELDSQPNVVAAEGLFHAFSSDLGATGEKWTREAFFEIDVPLLANKPLFRQLDVNGSARWTEDEFYGSAWTYSVKGGWRPFESLLLKASVGTSFRAPNLRENFIAGQSGFNTVFDPCAVPNDAILVDPVGGGFSYDASLDQRDPEVLANCIRENRDPTTVGLNPNSGQVLNVASIEINQSGTTDISEETSDSYTVGFSFEQPWFQRFDLNLGVSYYDIEIEDAIIEPSNGFLVSDCFQRIDTSSRAQSCDRLTYNGQFGLIDFIDRSFINQDVETVIGLDYNLDFSTDFNMFDEPFELGLNIRANQLRERSVLFVNDDLSISKAEFDGEFGFPEWTSTATATLDFDDYRITWQTRFIDAVEQDPVGIDPFDDALGTAGTGFFGDTCGTPEDQAAGILCRDIGFADEYYEHTVSLRYSDELWSITAGVDNVFDERPPLVDPNEVFSVSNIPLGNGYDLDGRQYFLSLRRNFR